MKAFRTFLLMTAIAVPTLVTAQSLTSLPPLPPLPGMESPPATVDAPEAAIPAPTEKVEIELPEMPVEEKLPAEEVADFGLFDPSSLSLASEETEDASAAIPPLPEDMDLALPEIPSMEGMEVPDMSELDEALAPPSLATATPEASPLSDMEPPVIAEVVPETPAPSEATVTESVVTPDIPLIPEMPDFPDFDALLPTDIAEPIAPPVLPSETPDSDVVELTPPELPSAAPEPDVAEIDSPTLPEKRPISKALVDAMPGWMSDETLPALKPLPQDRDIPEESPKPTKTAKKKQPTQKKEERSLADLIDEQIGNSGAYENGGAYGEDTGTIMVPELTDSRKADNRSKSESNSNGKRVVWPRNFKTQKLPPEIYRKKYRNANRHLPHAVYQKEIEAHLFGAVGANDPDAVRALLRTGAPLTIQNTMGESLVMHAVKTKAISTLQLLLALGAPSSEQDRYGATPLHRAVFMGRQDMAVILLRAGANVRVNDMSGITPMAIAVARRDQPMMQTLGYYQQHSRIPARNARNMAQYRPY